MCYLVSRCLCGYFFCREGHEDSGGFFVFLCVFVSLWLIFFAARTLGACLKSNSEHGPVSRKGDRLRMFLAFQTGSY
ncbi:Uncharacterized protein dnm_093360 [Desulfonema magnum]|uniref:Uncharacterized protein n=1 Tax=Desulfonema magnum TaxID=45655 RepID=A0A975BY17_9BACT|nr:Uncharacterized protein dnm_093360 [Desulfonema magnum]